MVTVRSALAGLVSLHFAVAVAAAPVAIENPGFEALYLGGNLPPQFGGDVPPTAFPVGNPPTGWQPYGAVGAPSYVGVLNPGVMAIEPMATSFPAGAPEGDNVVLLFHDGHLGGAEFGVTQTLSATLTANTRYTLTAEVGNIASGQSVVQPYASFGFFDLRGFPGYRVELLAGGAVIAADNDTLLPDEGIFETSTVQIVVRDSHPQLGQPLGIRLVNLNQADVLDPVVDLEVDFDAVSLDASPIMFGDYNGDEIVDAADYTVWRNNLDDPTEDDINHSGDGLSGVDEADYAIWRQHYGDSTEMGAGALAQSPVPEPAALVLAILSSLFSVGCWRKR